MTTDVPGTVIAAVNPAVTVTIDSTHGVFLTVWVVLPPCG